jgi:hypothetical protein
MALQDDGDLIKGLGFVCLYAAYLEEAIDDVFSAVIAVNGDDVPKMDRWQVSRKLKYIRHSMEAWEDLTEELARFMSCIEPIGDLLERRNLMIHGRIYADPKTGDVLKPARFGLPEVPAISSDMYELANELFFAKNPCLQASMFAIPRFLMAKNSMTGNGMAKRESKSRD